MLLCISFHQTSSLLEENIRIQNTMKLPKMRQSIKQLKFYSWNNAILLKSKTQQKYRNTILHPQIQTPKSYKNFKVPSLTHLVANTELT